jgi:glycosyltransferase involved in cell wall biosynthesis
MPTVSVLMSVFNGERWLTEAIQSVLDQTFTDFEFLIVNDGSTDGSIEIINQFADKDCRVRILDKSNTGLSDSLNYGIERASGEWTARMDADDLCEPQRLAKQIELARADKDLVLVGTGLTLIDQHGLEGKAFQYPVRHKHLVKRLAGGGPFFAHSSAMYKTKVARELGAYRSMLMRAEDHDFWLRLSERGKIGCVRASLVYIRKHDDQISHCAGGRRQVVDSHIARMAYWSRQMQNKDLLDSMSESTFDEFSNWVEIEIERAGYFVFANFISELKTKVSLENSAANKLIVLVTSFIGSPLNMGHWLRVRLFGSNLPKILLKKWTGTTF